MRALKGLGFLAGVALFSSVCLATPYVEGMWARLNPDSLLEYLSFIQLYPQTPEAKLASARIQKRLGLAAPEAASLHDQFQTLGDALVDRLLVSSSSSCEGGCAPKMNQALIEWIEQLAARQLAPRPSGGACKSLKALERLDPKEWDLTQVAYLCSSLDQVYSEEEARELRAKIDLLALCAKFAVQGKTYASETQRDLDMIEALNRVIFQEQGFAFPSLLDYMSQIDSYTSLPSLIDSKKGVCLGVSVLYLTLAQRVELPLTIVTPPGHIFLRYVARETPLEPGEEATKGVKRTRNIETTAYGMELPDETYRPLEGEMWVERSVKELPGLIFINAASVQLGKMRFDLAEKNYEVALRFLNPKTSFFVRELAAYASWLANPSRGMARVNQLFQEYLQGMRNAQASALVFDPVLLEDIAKGRLQPSMVAESFKEGGDDLRSQLKQLNQLEGFIKRAQDSRWLRMQQAMAMWHLGYLDQAWQAWPKNLKLDPKWQYVKVQLAIACQRHDEALKAFERLARELKPCDRSVMTPFDRLKKSMQERFFLLPPAT